MRKNLIASLVIVVFSLLIAFVIAEFAIRKIGAFDQDGTFVINDLRLLPIRLPVERTKKLIDELNKTNWERAVYIYHPIIGWINKPYYTFEKHGIAYYATVDGIRSGSSTSSPPDYEHSKLRIMLFGDSYTYAQDVTYEESWGNVIEQSLKNKGIDAEVLNMGLGGGNMGQAYLLWREIGKKYKPDIIVFGFQPENRSRNFILIDSIRTFDPGLPFSRPRFKIVNGDLKLFNTPTLTPEQALEVMRNISDWEWSGTDREKYRDHFWLKSKLASLIYTRFKINDLLYKSSVKEVIEDPNELAYAIIKQFKDEVEKEGSKFVVVLLPLGEVAEPKKANYNVLLDKLAEDMLVIRSKRMYEVAKKKSLKELFIPHYSPDLNKAIGEDAAEELAKML